MANNLTARPALGAESLDTLISRVEGTLLQWPVLEAILARLELGAPAPGDAAAADAIARELCRYANENGSWGNDLVWTSESLLLMRELTPHPAEPVRSAVDAAVAWLVARQDQPGAFGQGCDPARHEAALCEHAVSGFFSPAPAERDLSGTTLNTGARFPSDPSARFGASCLALQALLAWGVRVEPVTAHVGILRAIVARHAPVAGGLVDLAAYSVGVAAVCESIDAEADRVAALAGLTRLAALQRGDGSWPGVDVFHVLHVLLRATRLGHRLDAIDAAIPRAVGLLALMVNDQGRWSRDTGPERTLVAWRAFCRARQIAGSQH